ncbi:MAG TPA: glycoside hydrolase family 92 protein, partial [Zunongwangia profunda]|nr:glycoside hydrolase family 92 protein [Zunongwangia profunda]
EGYAKIELENGKAEEVILKVGISYVSIENAKNNLEKEIGNRSFDEVHEQAIETWEALLGAIKVKGGTKKQKQIFYSSLYRAFLWPALRSDLNGEFSDVEGKIKKADFRYYTLPSFWDTYRNKLVLLNMLQPDVAKDVIRSVIDRGENNGFIPTFFHGDHATSFISAAYNMGITDFEVQKAYDLLLNNAYKEGGTRPYISEYIEKGYIATPKIENPHVESKAKAGVSKTLEYAHDDYSLALLAKALGDSAHYEDLMKRSKNYRNVFDKNTHFMRGKLEDGTWVSPFDAEYPYYEYMYREANAWQLSFYVPHDMPGLVHLYGKEKFEEKLDSLFSTPWNPKHIARNVSGFMGLYSQGNQPDHETPFAYYFIDKPEKSQAVLDKLMQNYFGIEESENALSGMDDAGEMSSWYVFAASGVYPLSPADAEFLVSVPVFDEVTWTMPNGSILSFTHKGKGRKLKEIKVNSESVDGYFIPFQLFKSGGKVIVETGKD